jgi:hypothetical protein
VPVLGIFSAARFIRPYLKALRDIDYSITLRGETTTAAVLYESLIQSINNVYMDIVNEGFINKDLHPVEYELFDNPFRVVDGPCYAFLVHGKGPAVGGFGETLNPDNALTSSRIEISRNRIEGITCWNNEVPASVEEGKPVNDVRG